MDNYRYTQLSVQCKVTCDRCGIDSVKITEYTETWFYALIAFKNINQKNRRKKLEILTEEPKDMRFEKMKSELSTLKPELMLEDSARSMLASLLIEIDFRVCDNDVETLQLFFKRVYVGIEALKKERDELKKEIENLKKSLEEQPASLVISESL